MKQTRANAHSQAAKARWADPVIGAKMRAALRDPAALAKMREATKARWADPSKREKLESDPAPVRKLLKCGRDEAP
jgi:hypothetical protein